MSVDNGVLLDLDSEDPNFKNSIILGHNIKDNKPFSIPRNMESHGLIAGSTGRGKSVLAIMLFMELVKDASGIFIDPDGATVKKLLQYLSDDPFLAKRVVYWDINDTENIIGYNPLKKHPGLPESKQIDMLMEAILRAYDMKDFTQTPRLGRVLKMTFEILLATDGTLLDALSLVSPSPESDRRDAILEKARSADVFGFQEFESLFRLKSERARLEQFESSYNRIHGFVSDPVLRLIFGQKENCLDVKDIMENKKILLVNLKADRSVHASKLIGAMLLNEILQWSLYRDEDKSNTPVYTFCDEFSELATISVAKGMARCRKFSAWFVVIVQYLNQIRLVDPAIYDAVISLTDFKAIFGGTTFQDSELLRDEMLSGQINYKKPKLYRTYFEPIQEWMEKITKTTSGSETRGKSKSWNETNGTSESNGGSDSWQSSTSRSEGRSKNSGWHDGKSVPGSSVFDESDVRLSAGFSEGEGHTSSISHSDSQGGSRTWGTSQSHSVGHGESEQHSETSGWGRSVTRELVTFYKKMKEIAQYTPLEEIRYIVASFLKHLPKQVAIMSVHGKKAKVVIVKYLPDPKTVIVGYANRFRKRCLELCPYALPVHIAKKNLVRSERELLGVRPIKPHKDQKQNTFIPPRPNFSSGAPEGLGGFDQ